jgi:hypothetical protein
MSNIDRNEWLNRLKQSYPLEYSLGLEIMNRFNDIAQEVYAGSLIHPRKIEFILAEDRQTNKLALVMEQMDGLLLIAAVARTAVQQVLSVLDSPQELETKLTDRAKKRLEQLARLEESKAIKCNKCGYENKYYDNYCTKCGTQLNR